jgi:DNA-binding CsgD family transcriptional regulator
MGRKRQRQPRDATQDPYPGPLPKSEGASAGANDGSKGVDAAKSIGERLVERLAKLPHQLFQETVEPMTLTDEERLAWLTEREREVLVLYLELHNSKEVARRLGTQVQTVKNQLAAIEHKLGVDSREDMLAFAFQILR